MRSSYLGVVEYEVGRRLQEEALQRVRESRSAEDELIFCEHPPIITLGKRAAGRSCDRTFSAFDRTFWESRGVKVAEVDRGGALTYHGPGQLVFYPVVNLRRRRIGVRSFVFLGLAVIADWLKAIGVQAESRLDPPGVWCLRSPAAGQGDNFLTNASKIAAVGLRICQGVSNHGFSVNICCDLKPFELFAPCGYEGLSVTSVERELESGFSSTMREAAEQLAAAFAERLAEGINPGISPGIESRAGGLNSARRIAA